MDALNDSLSGGDLNRVNPPLRVEVTGRDMMGPAAKETVQRIARLAEDLTIAGQQVSVRVQQ